MGADHEAVSMTGAVGARCALYIVVMAISQMFVPLLAVIVLMTRTPVVHVHSSETWRREKEVAEAPSRAKSDFLSNKAHELRTPMYAILLFTPLGLQRIATELIAVGRSAQYLSRIDERATRLLKLVIDLLDLSEQEAGKVIY